MGEYYRKNSGISSAVIDTPPQTSYIRCRHIAEGSMMNMVYVGHPDEAFRNRIVWADEAMGSAEVNGKNIAYQIGACEIVCEGLSMPLDSVGKIEAVCRMSHMIGILSRASMFITKDGAIGMGKVPFGTPMVNSVTLPVAYNIDVLTSPDVNYLIYQEHIARMTLCKVDMASFLHDLRAKKRPALLLTGIGWWGVGQRRE